MVALNYGSRAEIVEAARNLALKARAGEIDPDAIDEAALEAELRHARTSRAGPADPHVRGVAAFQLPPVAGGLRRADVHADAVAGLRRGRVRTSHRAICRAREAVRRQVSELTIRILSGIAMIVVALMAAVLGGYYFAILVAAAATAMFYEWMRIVRGWGVGWKVGGFLYCLLPALALLWIRDRSGDQGLSILLWIFLVTWATDIGAYFAGRRVRQAQACSLHQPRQDRGRPLGRSCRGRVVRRRMGNRDGPEPRPDPACAFVCGRRAGGRLVRKQDEAQGRGQGLGRLAARAMAASWTVSMVSFRLPSSPSRREQQAWHEERSPSSVPTGSIGKSTLDLIERSPDEFEVVALTASVNVAALADAARRTKAKLAVIADEGRLTELETRFAGYALPRSSRRRRIGRSRRGGRGAGRGCHRRLRRIEARRWPPSKLARQSHLPIRKRSLPPAI